MHFKKLILKERIQILIKNIYEDYLDVTTQLICIINRSSPIFVQIIIKNNSNHANERIASLINAQFTNHRGLHIEPILLINSPLSCTVAINFIILVPQGKRGKGASWDHRNSK
jgi:hypothetical protein